MKAALNAISQLPLMEELDEGPVEEELSKANSLSAGKATEEDRIPPEVVKHGEEVLNSDLHELLCLCWREGAVPQDMRDTKIVTLYKNKGNHCGQGVCWSRLGTTASPGRACLPRVPVRVKS